MNTKLKNVLAVVAGLVSGSVINLLINYLGSYLVALPEGVVVSDPESIRENMDAFQPYHFIFPFLSHALGTLSGAVVAVLLAASHQALLARIIGVFFLIGGVLNAFMLPFPAWFIAIDLLLAYLPAACLGRALAVRLQKSARD